MFRRTWNRLFTPHPWNPERIFPVCVPQNRKISRKGYLKGYADFHVLKLELLNVKPGDKTRRIPVFVKNTGILLGTP